MANKTQPEWIQKFIDHTHEHGRLTTAQAAEMSGFTRRTLQHYLGDAVRLGGLYRTPRQGIFLSKHAYQVWCAEMGKLRQLAKEKAEEKAEEPEFMRPYNPALNPVCTECRTAPAMLRVLSFYRPGAAQ